MFESILQTPRNTTNTTSDPFFYRRVIWITVDSTILFFDVIILFLAIILMIYLIIAILKLTFYKNIKFYIVLLVAISELCSMISHILKLSVFEFDYGQRFSIEFEFMSNMFYINAIGIIIIFWVSLFYKKYSSLHFKVKRGIIIISIVIFVIIIVCALLIMLIFIFPISDRYGFSATITAYCCFISLIYAIVICVYGCLLLYKIFFELRKNNPKRSGDVWRLGLFTALIVSFLVVQSLTQLLSALIYSFEILKDVNPFLYGFSYIVLQNVPEVTLLLFFVFERFSIRKKKDEDVDTILDTALEDLETRPSSEPFGKTDSGAVFSKL